MASTNDATLALVESIGGGAYMRDLNNIMPPLPVPRLDADIGTLYYRPIEPILTLVWFPDPSIKPTREEGSGWGAYLRDKNT